MGNECGLESSYEREGRLEVLQDVKLKEKAATALQAYFKGVKTRRQTRVSSGPSQQSLDESNRLDSLHSSRLLPQTGHEPPRSEARICYDRTLVEGITVSFARQKLGPFVFDEAENDLPRLGPYLYNNGSMYIGQFKQGKRHGFGQELTKDGSFYEGSWRDGHREGKGRLIYTDGDAYEGSFVEGLPEGEGEFYHIEGGRYKGTWKKGKQDGSGFERWPDGSYYKGEYSGGRKHGQGTFSWADKTVYTGSFDENMMQGNGTMVYPDGRTFEGRFEENNMVEGIFKWPDGKIYEGQFTSNRRHGQGKMTWPSGVSYSGGWVDGKPEGVGTMTVQTEEEVVITQGTWAKGKREEGVVPYGEAV